MLRASGVIVAKLWWEQVARGKEWSQKIASRSEVTVRIPSVRGEIRDRNGMTLVGKSRQLRSGFLPAGYGARLQAEEPATWPADPETYTAPVRQMLKEKKEADVVQIVNTEHHPAAAGSRSGRRITMPSACRSITATTREVPFTYLEEIDFPTIAKFSEHNVGLPGVDISVRPVRQYVYGALAAHLLGYVGRAGEHRRSCRTSTNTIFTSRTWRESRRSS